MTEPMSREQVLAVLDAQCGVLPVDDDLHRARAAVAALYERCEALERDNDLLRHDKEKLRHSFQRARDGVMTGALDAYAVNKIYLGTVESVYSTGTEPSDAEGGG